MVEAILGKFEHYIESITVIPSSGGVFEVKVGDDLVFSKKEFVDSASKDYILVKLDFPRADKELAKKNKPIAEKYEIRGYPTIVLADADGKEFSRVVGAKYQTVDDFLAWMKKQLLNKDLD